MGGARQTESSTFPPDRYYCMLDEMPLHLLPQGSLCPHCNLEMVAVRNRVLDQLVPVLQRRWCLECGWNGVVRRVRSAHARSPKRSRAPRPTPR